MFPPLPSLLFITPFIIAVADGVPKFKLDAICGGTTEACINGETAARDTLAKQWAEFPPADRVRCVDLTVSSKMPSYVQVITCLELARNLRQLQAPPEQTPSRPAKTKK